MTEKMLSDFVEIMEYIWENDAKDICTIKHLKNRFGENLFEKFDRFSRGVQPFYATPHGQNEIFRLSGEGMRKLVEMGRIQNDQIFIERQGRENKTIQTILVFLTAILAFSSIFGPMYARAEGITKSAFEVIFMGFAIFILYIARKYFSKNVKFGGTGRNRAGFPTRIVNEKNR